MRSTTLLAVAPRSYRWSARSSRPFSPVERSPALRLVSWRETRRDGHLQNGKPLFRKPTDLREPTEAVVGMRLTMVLCTAPARTSGRTSRRRKTHAVWSTNAGVARSDHGDVGRDNPAREKPRQPGDPGLTTADARQAG
jgi:hypothetical protein